MFISLNLTSAVRSLVVICCLVFPQFSKADEGMWVFNNLPKEKFAEKYGFEPTAEWLTKVMRSSVRFSTGGSGSFISSNGLVLTNHHVASSTLHEISSATNDYLKDGFLAKTQAEEIPAKDLELNQLVEIQDVTERVNSVVTPDMTPTESAKARAAIISEIEKKSLEESGLRSDVVTLYQGGQYHLYKYKKYTDIRIVFAPESDIAFFGGEPDNFEFPRFCLDMTIMRVYENGKPAVIENYLKWTTDLAEDELVFVSGHPGRTSRLLTVDALKFYRDVRIPILVIMLQRREAQLTVYSSRSKEHARLAKDDLFGIQNSRKVYVAQQQGMLNPSFFIDKELNESELRAETSANPELNQYAGAWEKIAAAQKVRAKIYYKHFLLESAMAFDSILFNQARKIIRMAREDQLPDAQRLPEYRSSGRDSLLQSLLSDVPVNDDYEKYKLLHSIQMLVDEYGTESSLVKAILKGKDLTTRVEELVTKTNLKNEKVRKFLSEGDAKARQAMIEASKDSMIELARIVDSASLKLRKEFDESVQEVERQSYAQISKIIFATKGASQYPDATFTLRLSYGTVKGYEQQGSKIPAWTTIGGTYEHEKAHEGISPWKLPASWQVAKEKLDLTVPFNFVSTADIIGGNSGSPVINRNGDLVGLIFDGNVQSLTADFFYSDLQSRAVSVHAAGMLEALRKVYGASELADEIGK